MIGASGATGKIVLDIKALRNKFSPSSAGGKIDGVQILRFWAAMGIVLVHVGSSLETNFNLDRNYFTFGVAGVDVFFIISGFIIAYTADPDRGIFYFIKRRVARVVPLYWFLTIGIAAIALVMPSLLNSTAFEFGHLIKSLFFIAHEAPSGEIKPMLFLGWTLNYEVFFYALFALALLGGRWATWICIALLLTAVAWGGVVGQALNMPPPIVKFYTNTFLLEFAYGILLCIAWKHFPALFKRCQMTFFLSFLVAVAINILMPDLPGHLAYGLPAFLLVAASLPVEKVNHSILVAMVIGGDISYSLYLSHPYIVQVVVKISAPVLGFYGTIAACAIAVVVAIACAWLLYKLIEVPSQKLFQKPATHHPSPSVALS